MMKVMPFDFSTSDRFYVPTGPGTLAAERRADRGIVRLDDELELVFEDTASAGWAPPLPIIEL